jgi:hypothetical protein
MERRLRFEEDGVKEAQTTGSPGGWPLKCKGYSTTEQICSCGGQRRIERGIILGSLLKIFVATGKWLCREFIAAWSVFLFFLIGFLLLLMIVKLTLATFSIEATTLSKAIVGALFAAKAVLIMDETRLERHLEHCRRIIAVVVKTFLYGTITVLLGSLERILEARHRVHNFAAAAQYVLAQASLYRFLAWILGVTLVFALYFASFEINERMGEGELWALFFESPKTR